MHSESDMQRISRNVLFVAHDVALYGAQKSLLDIISKINRKVFDPHVVTPSIGPFTQELDKIGVKHISGLVQRWIYHPKSISLYEVLRRPWRGLNHPYLLAILSLVSLPFRIALLILYIRRHNVRLVYTNTATMIDGAVAARLCQIPHIWHLRERVAGNVDLASPFPVSWLPAFILRNSKFVITNSNMLARELFGNPLPGKVRVIHNGVDIEKFKPIYPQEVLNLPDGIKLTAVCGVIQEQKDILTFVRAVARLRDTHPKLHHLVIGRSNPVYQLKLEAEIASLGLTNRIHFLGYRDDIPALFSKIDILVSTSLYETFGRTLIEAMAAGKPVISVCSGGPEEIIENGKSGFLVDIGDDSAIAVKIAALLDNPDDFVEMSAAAMHRAETVFNLKNVVKRIETILDESLVT